MRALDILRISGYLLCCCGMVCHAKRGFILTGPKIIDAGNTEYFTFTAFDVPPGGVVSLKLLHWYTGEVVAESELNVLSNMNMWVEMVIPTLTKLTKTKLQVQGNFSDGYRINTEKEVLVRHKSVLTFVQTDKPLYKPGQLVRFRILPMDSQLRPLVSEVANVWIEDPSGVKVAQWSQVQFTEGMTQLELPLSNEPNLGIWSIKVIIKEETTSQNFNVEKYVLPKFDVTIKPPPYIMADAETFSVEICAVYSYGKKVDGKVKVKVSYEENSLYPYTVEYSGLISGCYTFIVNTRETNLLQGYKHGILQFYAEVIENGTEIVANATTKLRISESELVMKFLGTEGETDYFKPGIPFYGQLQVQKPDGEVAPSEKIEICAEFFNQHESQLGQRSEKKCQRFTTNKKGRVRFIVPPQSSAVSKIELIAETVNYHNQGSINTPRMRRTFRPRAALYLNPWYSASGSYLQIQPTADEMECEKLHRVKVRYTGEREVSIKFFHKVISRGRLVQQGSHQRTFYSKNDRAERKYNFESDSTDHSTTSNWPLKTLSTANETDIGEFDLSFDPRATMSPVARLLIYYVREDGEIVADSRKFRIAKCLLNKVNLHFRHEQQYPSTEASLLLSATPSSVCGIGMVDKSVRFLKRDNQFKIEKIFDVLEEYDVGKNAKPFQVTKEYCMLKESDNQMPNNREETTPDSRLTPPVYSQLFRKVSIHVDTSMAFEEAGMIVATDFELETRPCVQSEPVAVPFRRGGRRKGGRKKIPLSLGNSAPSAVPVQFSVKEQQKSETEKQTVEIRTFFPETWLWEMHTVGVNGEMALRKQLPHTITQWVGQAVCIHPKTGLGISEDTSITAFQPFFISFRLPYSVIRGEVLPLVVTVFNYLTECLPIKLSLEQSSEYVILSESWTKKLCVCGGESSFHKFIIKPSALGEVNVTVYGYSMEDDDEVCGNEITARLSARDAVSKQLKVEAEGIHKEEVYNYYICPKNTNGSYAAEVDLLPPEDVVEGSARAYVSISGDLMGPALEGLQKLVRLPTGCGEQNMILFTPNIFVLDYLTSTGNVNEEINEKCINNMKTGYQRELRYKHPDGSFSAFGASDREGSLWLTSFVIRSFGQAARFIEIDETDLRRSTSWILKNQFENGCFQPTGRILHKDMKGGLNDGDHSLAPLTAYVLIALVESGRLQVDHPAVQNSLKCLEQDANPSLYALSLFAYAYALTKENSTAHTYLKMLDDRAHQRGSTKYWETKSQSLNVEIAGYYILAYTELEQDKSLPSTLPVIRWITKQRNSNGGFISTQDTMVALQAIVHFSTIQHGEVIDMGLVIDTDGLVKGFKLNQDNKLLTQNIKIPEVPAVVDLQAVGDGCALVQFSLRYNIMNISGSDAFDLNINAARTGSSNCNTPTISICMRYKITGQVSNMVVLSIKMPSGYIPEDWSIYKLESDANVKLKRHDIDDNMVHLYFDELSNEQKCFKLFVTAEMEVEDIKPSTITLCDYYQPELQITKEYSIPSMCAVTELPPMLPPLVAEDASDSEKPSLHTEITLSPTDKTATNHERVSTAAATEQTFDITLTDWKETHEAFSTVAYEFTTTRDDETLKSIANDEDKILMFPNFTDVEHDLDVPDGLEGNIPVTVLPPTTESMSCPFCSDKFSNDFTELYCSSLFVLKAIAQDAGTVKILQDVSSLHLQPKTIDQIIMLDYDRNCDCSQLYEKGKSLVMLSINQTLWNEEKHQIQLTPQVYIISTSLQPELVQSAQNSCTNDP